MPDAVTPDRPDASPAATAPAAATPAARTAARTAAQTAAQRRHDPSSRGFASDNYAGVHPEVLAAIALANDGHQVAYGEDAYTAHLHEVFQ
ncbi:MAG TPA: hypothetical protein VLH10_07555, partial [Yinghuangia sp.]|nr:hypothetical protein [Yinghuangia sp.]